MIAKPEPGVETNGSFDNILKNWLSLTNALNALNRGMGLPDLYPFVLSTPAIEKMRFIHQTVEEARKASALVNSSSATSREPARLTASVALKG